MSQTNHPWDGPVTGGTSLDMLAELAVKQQDACPSAPKIAPKTPSLRPPKLCLEHTAFSTPIENQIENLQSQVAELRAEVIELRLGLARMFIETDTGLDGVPKESRLGKSIIDLAQSMGLMLYE